MIMSVSYFENFESDESMVAASRVREWSAPYSLSATILACSVCVVCMWEGGNCRVLLYSGVLALVRSSSDRISWSVVPKIPLNFAVATSWTTLTG